MSSIYSAQLFKKNLRRVCDWGKKFHGDTTLGLEVHGEATCQKLECKTCQKLTFEFLGVWGDYNK